ncbi:MAG TPA: hypothetical protein DEE98_04570 [Elusimicrobia bacterium]|nr:MAG: hypothetical protein A2278_04260 [Elusimicrobia bacterium RIFOXYA12_FULL_49_49]OGS09776.1 MAG: hypothetical protein A2204_01230 [Elusimicrobia bacterium RIFOXYA1_FULL_47_7]OGS10512.1 MAG: hypothetical protein A2386_05410 [Elusimicrobia bacterium RIFOXYB1_FULL_48_9]OGS14736.1 MAG: hypothetical protein A2251_09585 [Elusimicrobia bacterium RIFOXYA2_FULL_47_53]OGS25612.1 MAG: hypothetical protein A2339_06005 [Elusimicrobia bacterium RIFOXYB12_FULL_50_12]OGS31827.1 MAG: hypothetical protein
MPKSIAKASRTSFGGFIELLELNRIRSKYSVAPVDLFIRSILSRNGDEFPKHLDELKLFDNTMKETRVEYIPHNSYFASAVEAYIEGDNVFASKFIRLCFIHSPHYSKVEEILIRTYMVKLMMMTLFKENKPLRSSLDYEPSPYRTAEIDEKQFPREYKGGNDLVDELLEGNDIDMSNPQTITRQKLTDVFNLMINIPNMISVIEKNSPPKDISADLKTLMNNKMKLADVFPRSLKNSRKYDEKYKDEKINNLYNSKQFIKTNNALIMFKKMKENKDCSRPNLLKELQILAYHIDIIISASDYNYQISLTKDCPILRIEGECIGLSAREHDIVYGLVRKTEDDLMEGNFVNAGYADSSDFLSTCFKLRGRDRNAYSKNEIHELISSAKTKIDRSGYESDLIINIYGSGYKINNNPLFVTSL